jgi:nucleotide-binding universal stress UspA family protein
VDDHEAPTERWNERQDRLQALLAAHGAAGLDFRADLGKGRFWWQDADGAPVVVASVRLLLSYALSDQSVLMGWANRSVPSHATVPMVGDMAERVPDCSEADAWMWARRVADAVGAHFIYRAPSPQSWVFLGLWDVRRAGEGDEPFVAASPWPHVVDVLENLVEAVAEGRDVRVLAHGYGRTFIESHVHRGTPAGERLRSIGERLAALANDESPELGPKLIALRDEGRSALAEATTAS